MYVWVHIHPLLQCTHKITKLLLLGQTFKSQKKANFSSPSRNSCTPFICIYSTLYIPCILQIALSITQILNLALQKKQMKIMELTRLPKPMAAKHPPNRSKLDFNRVWRLTITVQEHSYGSQLRNQMIITTQAWSENLKMLWYESNSHLLSTFLSGTCHVTFVTI